MIPVTWFGGKGYWDHGLLLEAFAGTLYRTPRPYLYEDTPHPMTEPLDMVGAVSSWPLGNIGIFPRQWKTTEEAIDLFVRTRPWSIVISCSDEEARHDIRPRNDRSILWYQTPGPRQCWYQTPGPRQCQALRPFCFGWPQAVRTAVPMIPDPHSFAYRLWNFVGQSNHAFRAEAVNVLRQRPEDEGYLLATDGFARSSPKALPYEEYLRLMLYSKIAICPSALHTPDQFRIWEALEMGCLPIAQTHAPGRFYPNADYFKCIFQGGAPFPKVFSWTELPSLLDAYATDELLLQAETNKSVAWWIGQKRRFVLNLEEDVRTLSGLESDPTPGLRGKVTVLMPTSPIPSHPSTAVIEETVEKLRAYPALAECEIIIMVDGVRPEQEHRRAAYEEYKRRLLWLCNWDPRFAGCLSLVFDDWKHQAAMTMRALEEVQTDLVFFVEHDTWPMGEIDFEGIANVIERDHAAVIRLHIFDDVRPEHQQLYSERKICCDGTMLLATRQWSQRPHLARTDWYREMLAQNFSEHDRSMIEDRVIGRCEHEGWPVFIYAPQGSLLRSGTSNGRGEDPKYPMYWGGREWR